MSAEVRCCLGVLLSFKRITKRRVRFARARHPPIVRNGVSRSTVLSIGSKVPSQHLSRLSGHFLDVACSLQEGGKHEHESACVSANII